MALRKCLVALLTAGAMLVLASPALAAFPDLSDCPTEIEDVGACIQIVNTSGNLNIDGFNVPLHGASLEIRGGFAGTERGPVFVPPAGTNGFFSRAFPVPGGLLGIDWIPGTSVLAITELAGNAEDISIDITTLSVRVPVKVRLVNIFLGMNCHIGTNSNPVHLSLATTRLGTPSRSEEGALVVTGNVNAESSFAVPAASECGLGLGLINALVNLKLGLPSAEGNNSVEVTNNIAFEF